MKANKPTGGKFSRFIMAQKYLAETTKEMDEQVQTVASGSTSGLRVEADVKGEKEKNSWLLGKMFESGFPDASGREEG